MTVYHVHGCLNFQAKNASYADRLYDAIVQKVTSPDTVFSDYRNTNTYAKEVLPDGVTRITFTIRFILQSDRDTLADDCTALSNRLADTYYSYIHVHVCHHDEGVGMGIEDPVTTEYGVIVP